MITPEFINIKDKTGNMPLHYASMKGHTEMVKLLIKVGSKVDAKNRDGNTPLHFAFKTNNIEVFLHKL